MVSCVRNAFAPFGLANYFRGKISETICAVERSIVKLFSISLKLWIPNSSSAKLRAIRKLIRLSLFI